MKPTLRMWRNRLSTFGECAGDKAVTIGHVMRLFYLIPLRLAFALLQLVCTAEGIFILFIAGILIPIGYLYYAEKERERAIAELFKPTPLPNGKGMVISVPANQKPPPNVEKPATPAKAAKKWALQTKPPEALAEQDDIEYILEGLGYENNGNFKHCVLMDLETVLRMAKGPLTMKELNETRDACIKIESKRKEKEAAFKQTQALSKFVTERKSNVVQDLIKEEKVKK